MNHDELDASAKTAALAAVLNLLLKHMTPEILSGIRTHLGGEVDRISDGNSEIADAARNYIRNAMDALK